MPQLSYGDARRGVFVAKWLALKRFVKLRESRFRVVSRISIMTIVMAHRGNCHDGNLVAARVACRARVMPYTVAIREKPEAKMFARRPVKTDERRCPDSLTIGVPQAQKAFRAVLRKRLAASPSR